MHCQSDGFGREALGKAVVIRGANDGGTGLANAAIVCWTHPGKKMVMFTHDQLERYLHMTALVPISHAQATTIVDWLYPERPGLIMIHALNSGQGRFLVDRWPAPRVVLVSINKLHSVLGDPAALQGKTLPFEAGLMFCSERFLPWLRAASAEVKLLDRVVLRLSNALPTDQPAGVVLRRLTSGDASSLSALSPDLQFISNTWGGPAGLAASGYGWGAFVDDRLVSVAATFLLGNETEDLGVVTELAFRGRGLAVACAAQLFRDIQQRGRQATWTTSTDNHASIRVAEKLGFKIWTHESLYVVHASDRVRGQTGEASQEGDQA